jgi:hypothetical protein
LILRIAVSLFLQGLQLTFDSAKCYNIFNCLDLPLEVYPEVISLKKYEILLLANAVTAILYSLTYNYFDMTCRRYI